MIWSKIGSNMVSRDKVLIWDLCACWAYKDSSAWWCDDWLEPSIRESIVTARKWLLKALWNFKMKKSSRIQSSEHHIIKQERRACRDSWSKPRQQFLDHAHLTHWKKSCAVTPMSTYLLVVTSTLQVVKTLWLQASTIATAMLYLTKVSKRNLGQNFSGDSPGIMSECLCLPAWSTLFSFMDSICSETCRILVDWSRRKLRECQVASDTICITR